jgi:hypothetical protein
MLDTVRVLSCYQRVRRNQMSKLASDLLLKTRVHLTKKFDVVGGQAYAQQQWQWRSG